MELIRGIACRVSALSLRGRYSLQGGGSALNGANSDVYGAHGGLD